MTYKDKGSYESPCTVVLDYRLNLHTYRFQLQHIVADLTGANAASGSSRRQSSRASGLLLSSSASGLSASGLSPSPAPARANDVFLQVGLSGGEAAGVVLGKCRRFYCIYGDTGETRNQSPYTCIFPCRYCHVPQDICVARIAVLGVQRRGAVAPGCVRQIEWWCIFRYCSCFTCRGQTPAPRLANVE